ncbi:holo-ACP synthase [Acidithiobacillus sp. CV18-2]|uniref:Holo-[acyl-carrier-protein] synthase n=1 Tax=Igneacidithiobacillus copahuensis TaxID=2724909 RepID=A0AAE2YSA3_9PROT|nr:holo-ACP synthase [Acidithiobacillus sp. CV18-3]MBU2757437.1 holo-ACP synthase [Acidithiobacillus sp. BN09-2]MBU2777291.1 holo-ACP synthase [Acidithiobacillus sp. CV18-2]MBU2789146.1 holo-ACP synthase [Igneacidithiobacillus copahuensis]MBU2796226.1 holo-ACP synthase [Acidithiobacillus sp. VAN18-2]MBU2798427.1 holo-ACP synthase [Acidithiobacillus sp. VAN18-4]UTV82200.1 holo-ACP synthase [Acidithiobacillus sp. YTS05]
MIVGLGTDLVSVERMASLLDRWGDRLLSRVLGEQEYAELPAGQGIAAFLARRFAAKEATVKALGTGFRNGICLEDIQVRHDPLGRPTLSLRGAAQRQLLHCARQPRLWLSLTDEHRYAMATVVIEELAPEVMGTEVCG